MGQLPQIDLNLIISVLDMIGEVTRVGFFALPIFRSEKWAPFGALDLCCRSFCKRQVRFDHAGAAESSPHEPLSKLLKGGYIGDYIGDYYRAY